MINKNIMLLAASCITACISCDCASGMDKDNKEVNKTIPKDTNVYIIMEYTPDMNIVSMKWLWPRPPYMAPKQPTTTEQPIAPEFLIDPEVLSAIEHSQPEWHYTAPEVMMTNDYYGRDVDLFSIGCIAYELMDSLGGRCKKAERLLSKISPDILQLCRNYMENERKLKEKSQTKK